MKIVESFVDLTSYNKYVTVLKGKMFNYSMQHNIFEDLELKGKTDVLKDYHLKMKILFFLYLVILICY